MGVFMVFTSAMDAEEGLRMYRIPAGMAEETLKIAADQGRMELVYTPETVNGIRTQAIQGKFQPKEALEQMVGDTPLVVVPVSDGNAFGIVNRTESEGPGPLASDPSATAESTQLPPSEMNLPNLSKQNTFFKTLAALLTLGLSVTTKDVTAQDNETEREIFTLSPFNVNAADDTGYRANSTLAGSRFNTSLRDTAASISVMTSEFIGDIGANSLSEALLYSTSAQPDQGDASAAGLNPNGNRIQSGLTEFRVRGQPTSKARNYFTLRVPGDNYNVERIEDSRGPNSVLFGFGAPGGIINISTKQAYTDHSFGEITLQGGSYGSLRSTIDVNRVVNDGKLAIRLNALYDKTNSLREYAFNRDRRFDLAIKYQITPTTQFRASYEHGMIRSNKPRPFELLDGGVVKWLEVGAPTFATVIPSNAELSITRLGTARRLTWIENSNTLIAGSLLNRTKDANIAILDRYPGLSDPSINYGGAAQINDNELNDFSVFLEQSFGTNTFLELGFNHQDQSVERYNPGTAGNSKLWGDPNQFLKDGVTPNPYVGQLYMEGSSNTWERYEEYDSSNIIRATLSTEIEAEKWGNYRIAILGEHDNRLNQLQVQREAWEGAPFDPRPENGRNQLRRRKYVTVGEWDTYYIPSPVANGFLRGVTDPLTGQTLNSTWVNRSAGQQDDPETQKSWLISTQARYFDGRLVFGAGTRYDKLEILDRTATRHPDTNEWTLDFPTETNVERTARNSTYGVMGHLTPNISVFYNRADNQGLGSAERITDINNPSDFVLTPNSKGEGEDYGVALELFDGKINARITHYNTDAVDLSSSYGGTGIGPTSAAGRILGALEDAGLITMAEVDAHTPNVNAVIYDLASEGYEVNLTANPTRNWRLQATYSDTDTRQANFGPGVRAWMDQEIAYWRSFNASDLEISAGLTIEEAIEFMENGYNLEKNLEKIGELGLRKHKVGLFTRYDFTENRLKGAYIGGGYRYQSKNLAGSDDAREKGFYGPSFTRADFLAGYKFGDSAFGDKDGFFKGLTIQLNVFNVFDDHDALITRILPDGGFRRAVVQDPRTWRLQASIDF